MPNWKKVITSGSDAKLNSALIDGGGDILHVSGNAEYSGSVLPSDDNVFDLGTTSKRWRINGGTPVVVTGSGVLNYTARWSGSTELMTSSIYNDDRETIITHSGSGNNTIFTISGSNGELLKVTDTASLDLFRVNDISGLRQFSVSSSGDLVAPEMNYGNHDFYLSYNSGSGEIRFTSQSVLNGSSGTSGTSGTSGVDGLVAHADVWTYDTTADATPTQGEFAFDEQYSLLQKLLRLYLQSRTLLFLGFQNDFFYLVQ